jgi:ABC-type branched-subunit amino acid transport system ATPase component
LIGPNGAGKTTLFNVISGAQKVNAGHVRFADQDVTAIGPVGRGKMGLARTFQNLSLVGTLTVAENVSIGFGRFRRAGLLASMLCLPLAIRQDQRLAVLTRSILEFVGLHGVSDRKASELPYGDRRRLELARALASAPRLLLLDEPSAGMDPAETADLVALLRCLPDAMGTTVLVVEHDMSFVRTLADRTTVLDFGKVIATGPTDEVLASPEVAEAYLGTRKG